MVIAIGSDHAGFELKEKVKELLGSLRLEFKDMGCFGLDPVDYPDYGEKIASAINKGEYPKAILICGTGIGMSIIANRFPKVRAALCHNEFTARASREHNDANILILGARVIPEEDVDKIVRIWLETEFAGGRHQGRLDKIAKISQFILINKFE